MEDRDMVYDILTGTKSSINSYTHAIMETSNQQLRNSLIQLRDEAEQMQYQISQMASQKGWYTPAPQANQNDVDTIKSTLSAAVSSTSSSMNTSSNAKMNSSNNSKMNNFKPMH
ncbi:spore coat protein [Paratissierella segnis]|jgi:spore coat protein CotF|uniref:Spore coat protein n=1 Tax=Paratissierella segnis TaxID=2763679 RepID=A0A926IE28_9FIRM|nr:spore coat protein [Paratissierella segnis]MBC8586917.1 spore coat protein [Paratissierella segnis]